MAYVLDKGEIVSRTVVSTKDKTWVRAYARNGCSTKCVVLTKLLMDQGYTQNNLVGNRLTMLDTEEVMLPYIDGGCQGVKEVVGYWLVVKGRGDYAGENVDGTAVDCRPYCQTCSNRDCECLTCECCDTLYSGDGCGNCDFCSECNNCEVHHECTCETEEDEEEDDQAMEASA